MIRSKGMIVNEADMGFRKRLGGFYARWKGIYGDKICSLLEARGVTLV
jgi:TRAP-type transport system periplasmic protein